MKKISAEYYNALKPFEQKYINDRADIDGIADLKTKISEAKKQYPDYMNIYGKGFIELPNGEKRLWSGADTRKFHLVETPKNMPKNLLIADTYFKLNPSKILGKEEQKKRGDRGEYEFETIVKGSLNDALKLIDVPTVEPFVSSKIQSITECKKLITNADYVIDTLQSDVFYSEKMNYKSIANNVNMLYRQLSKYTKQSPLYTNFNDAVYFNPDKRLIERDGICNAWIKYCTHFVSSQTPRVEDNSKLELMYLIEPTLKLADSRYTQQNDDNTVSVIYTKLIVGEQNFAVVIKIDTDNDGLFKTITILPNQRTTQISKKIANNTWVLSATSSLELLTPQSPSEKTPSNIGDNKATSTSNLSINKAIANIRLYLQNDTINKNILNQSIEYLCKIDNANNQPLIDTKTKAKARAKALALALKLEY